MYTLATFILHGFGSPSHSNQRRKGNKKIKVIQIGKEEVKLSLYADDMILIHRKSNNAIRKLLELIS